MVSTNFICI